MSKDFPRANLPSSVVDPDGMARHVAGKDPHPGVYVKLGDTSFDSKYVNIYRSYLEFRKIPEGTTVYSPTFVWFLGSDSADPVTGASYKLMHPYMYFGSNVIINNVEYPIWTDMFNYISQGADAITAAIMLHAKDQDPSIDPVDLHPTLAKKNHKHPTTDVTGLHDAIVNGTKELYQHVVTTTVGAEDFKTDGAVFIYLGDTGTFTKGHIYQYNSNDDVFVDITPLTPAAGAGSLTIKVNNVEKVVFSANEPTSSAKSVNIEVPIVDEELNDESTHAISNSAVAEAIEEVNDAITAIKTPDILVYHHAEQVVLQDGKTHVITPIGIGYDGSTDGTTIQFADTHEHEAELILILDAHKNVNGTYSSKDMNNHVYPDGDLEFDPEYERLGKEHKIYGAYEVDNTEYIINYGLGNQMALFCTVKQYEGCKPFIMAKGYKALMPADEAIRSSSGTNNINLEVVIINGDIYREAPWGTNQYGKKVSHTFVKYETTHKWKAVTNEYETYAGSNPEHLHVLIAIDTNGNLYSIDPTNLPVTDGPLPEKYTTTETLLSDSGTWTALTGLMTSQGNYQIIGISGGNLYAISMSEGTISITDLYVSNIVSICGYICTLYNYAYVLALNESGEIIKISKSGSSSYAKTTITTVGMVATQMAHGRIVSLLVINGKLYTYDGSTLAQATDDLEYTSVKIKEGYNESTEYPLLMLDSTPYYFSYDSSTGPSLTEILDSSDNSITAADVAGVHSNNYSAYILVQNGLLQGGSGQYFYKLYVIPKGSGTSAKAYAITQDVHRDNSVMWLTGGSRNCYLYLSHKDSLNKNKTEYYIVHEYINDVVHGLYQLHKKPSFLPID